MAINGLNQYDLYSSNNSINITDRIPRANSQEIGGQVKRTPMETVPTQHEKIVNQPTPELARPINNASIENISLSLKSSSDFAMKGRNSSLSDLDMEKAVSDMQRDQSLMQYQYFVGNSNVIRQDDDGVVLQKIPQSS